MNEIQFTLSIDFLQILHEQFLGVKIEAQLSDTDFNCFNCSFHTRRCVANHVALQRRLTGLRRGGGGQRPGRFGDR